MTEREPQYCQCNGNACPCGKFGDQILACRKPLPLYRLTEVFDDMRTSMAIEKEKKQ